MPDDASYTPPPRRSGPSGALVVLIALFVLLIACGIGLLGFGALFFYTAVDIQRAPQPVLIEEGEMPIREPVDMKEPAPAEPEDSSN